MRGAGVRPSGDEAYGLVTAPQKSEGALAPAAPATASAQLDGIWARQEEINNYDAEADPEATPRW